ncbi:GspH/FimT family pseudopilin [Geopseudomonas sagittaria]|uniref:GspH/FimT family pseudopilin n=1 Tax=Geopseudomonas sagittaria TaxID=1135990 RepID=UPI000B832577|nr:GspH/FimT family pseudopilin [Pseudomonas sagittaria]
MICRLERYAAQGSTVPGRSRRRQRAFTLIELMVTIAVLAVLMGIAIPSFSEFSLSSRLRSYGTSLVASAQLARSEAIKRNRDVTLCMSANGTSCANSGSWEQGWIVLQGATVIHQQQSLAAGYRVTAVDDVTSIAFRPSGVGATQTTLRICRASPSAGSQERVVTISATGRTSVEKTTDGSCPSA